MGERERIQEEIRACRSLQDGIKENIKRYENEARQATDPAKKSRLESQVASQKRLLQDQMNREKGLKSRLTF